MFWKRKKTSNTNPIDVLHPAQDKRRSYRYEFKEDQTLMIRFKEKDLRVINISAGGIAFKNEGFAQFDFDFIKFVLDIPNFVGDPTLFAGLRILKIDEEGICHCIFEQCPLEQHEMIHKYVLEMQKNDLAH